MVSLAGLFPNDAAELLVVAPHPDDEVLGCGALLAAAAAAMPARVLYVTDGSASHRNSASYPPERLARVREAEARRGLRHLGVACEPVFLRVRDGHVPAADSADGQLLIRRIRDTISEDVRTVVALPWRRDPHADHRAVALLAAQAVRERPLAATIEYGVWLGLIGDAEADRPRADEGVAVDFDARPWVTRKNAALREHRSQLGEIVHDADWAFVMPPDLLDRAGAPVETFVIGTAA